MARASREEHVTTTGDSRQDGRFPDKDHRGAPERACVVTSQGARVTRKGFPRMQAS